MESNKPKWMELAECYEAALYEFLEDPYINWGRLGDVIDDEV